MKRVLAVFLIFAFAVTFLTACGKNENNEETGASTHGQNEDESGRGENNTTDLSKAPEKETGVSTDIPEGAKLIALTYDDGPYTKTSSRILETLKKNNSVATFFLVGNRIEGTESTIKEAIDMGCEIANHTFEHENLTKLGDAELKKQIESTNSKMQQLFGYEVKLLRAPGGAVKGIKEKVGMPLIQWSIDTEDWKNKDAANPGRSEAQRSEKINEIVNDVLEDAESGDIVLMHDIYDFTADLSERLIPKLIEKGFTLVTVSQLFDYYGIELEDGGVYTKAKIQEPETTFAPGAYTVKIDTDPTLNLRDNPGMDGAVIAEIPNGTLVNVTEVSGNWAKVTYGSFTGWISKAFLVPAA